MKTLILILSLLVTQPLRADFPSYGYVKVKLSQVNIYEGDSTKSKVAGTASKGEEFLLRAEKSYKGFYKIQYEGHVHFIMASQVNYFPPEDAEPTPEEEDQASPVPTATAKKSPTAKPTLKPTQEAEEEGEATPLPTRAATLAPTRVPTQNDVEPTVRPTAMPTAKPDWEEPTRQPTRWATVAPTPWEPTPEATAKPDWVEPTAVPTRWQQATLAPTAKPDWVEPTAVPTRWQQPTAEPTRWQQPTPAPQPTQAYYAPTPVPVDPWAQAQTIMAKGKRLKQQVQTGVDTYRRVTGQGQRRQTYRQQNQYANNSTGSSGFQAQRSTRLGLASGGGGKSSPGFSIYMPVGGGKPYNVRPAFRPDTGIPIERRIEEAGFMGLELELRPFSFWRLTADWQYGTHATKATDLYMGFPVDTTLPPNLPIAFLDASSTYYTMDTHAFRLGMKFSVPLPMIEPWVGGTMGLYAWHADYRDKAKTISYGEASGTAFGLTAAGGIDFKIRAGQGFFILTPFYEYGSPIVNPEIKDIAGLGVDWKDRLGTPVIIPSRFGLKLGWGF